MKETIFSLLRQAVNLKNGKFIAGHNEQHKQRHITGRIYGRHCRGILDPSLGARGDRRSGGGVIVVRGAGVCLQDQGKKSPPLLQGGDEADPDESAFCLNFL